VDVARAAQALAPRVAPSVFIPGNLKSIRRRRTFNLQSKIFNQPWIEKSAYTNILPLNAKISLLSTKIVKGGGWQQSISASNGSKDRGDLDGR
jgi:hypothetical protein